MFKSIRSHVSPLPLIYYIFGIFGHDFYNMIVKMVLLILKKNLQSRGEINKWHSKDFPQASTAASNFSFESSQNDRKILEEDTEKPTTDRNLNFILVTILISIILAIILGMRF